MPLKIQMEPYERLIIGPNTITNCWGETATIFIEGQAPVLREAHTMTAELADAPLKRVYLAVQTMYLDGVVAGRSAYDSWLKVALSQQPSLTAPLAKVRELVEKGSFYGAMRELRKFVAIENTRERVFQG
jgi:flagellar protein FlbT